MPRAALYGIAVLKGLGRGKLGFALRRLADGLFKPHSTLPLPDMIQARSRARKSPATGI